MTTHNRYNPTESYNPTGVGTDHFDYDLWEANYKIVAEDILPARYPDLSMGPIDRQELQVAFPDQMPLRECYQILYEVSTIYEAYGLYEGLVSGMRRHVGLYMGDENDPLSGERSNELSALLNYIENIPVGVGLDLVRRVAKDLGIEFEETEDLDRIVRGSLYQIDDIVYQRFLEIISIDGDSFHDDVVAAIASGLEDSHIETIQYILQA